MKNGRFLKHYAKAFPISFIKEIKKKTHYHALKLNENQPAPLSSKVNRIVFEVLLEEHSQAMGLVDLRCF